MDTQTLQIVILILLLVNVILTLLNLFRKKDKNSENYVERNVENVRNVDIEKYILELYMKIRHYIPSLSPNDEKKLLEAFEVIKKHREQITELLKIYMPKILYESKEVNLNNLNMLNILKKLDNLKSNENVEPLHLLLTEADSEFKKQLQLSSKYFGLEAQTWAKYVSEKNKNLKQHLLNEYNDYRNKVTESNELAYKLSQVMIFIKKEIDAKQQSHLNPNLPRMHNLPGMTETPRNRNLPGMTESPRNRNLPGMTEAPSNWWDMQMPFPNFPNNDINLRPKPNQPERTKQADWWDSLMSSMIPPAGMQKPGMTETPRNRNSKIL